MNYCENRGITTLERDKARDSWDMLYGIRNTLRTFKSRVQFPSPAPIPQVNTHFFILDCQTLVRHFFQNASILDL